MVVASSMTIEDFRNMKKTYKTHFNLIEDIGKEAAKDSKHAWNIGANGPIIWMNSKEKLVETFVMDIVSKYCSTNAWEAIQFIKDKDYSTYRKILTETFRLSSKFSTNTR